MFRRKMCDTLKDWKNSSVKKALCIIGARQIGKTTLIRNFCQDNYECFAEINFITEPQAKSIFAGSLDADTLITNITAYTRKKLIPQKSVIFFDEIQACPEARTAIKFLVEDGRFNYVESGSLLGVKHREITSYPVGFEEIKYMYPMDFEEFCWALNVPVETISYLKGCHDKLQPVEEAIHQTMLRLFQLYIVIGGMPSVVSIYTQTQDITSVINEQNAILELYRMDIAKYSEETNKPKIRAVFNSIPAQLSDKNRRFVIADIDRKGRMHTYETSFLWLDAAGVALPCYNVAEPRIPLLLNEKRNLFRLYMNDTGLLCAACMENIQTLILSGDVSVNMGSILENVFAQEIKSKNAHLNYFDVKKYGELDFVIQNGSNIDLFEIKSGKQYKNHSSLSKIMNINEWSFRKCHVYCCGNIETNNNVTYYPWYMIMFYEFNKISPKQTYIMDLSALKNPPSSLSV